MNGKKKVCVGLILAVLLIAVAAGVVWFLTHFYLVDFHFYPKDVAALDLRGQEITAEHYDKLQSKMPACQIRWDIPFQGTTYPDDTTELTVRTLTQEDLIAMFHFIHLDWNSGER